MAESPAEELREAAKLMRERAERVGGPPVWAANRMDEVQMVYRDDEGTERARLLVARCSLPSGTDYIASMHPGVALAVADWLDQEAVNAEAFADHGHALAAPSPHASEVARAYLGSDPQ